ncbi:hypothetical protein SEA_DIZZYRUDY_38 [Microbacterium phage DizzyRudy]|nr:hypothetical protein SEA_DIZZYRUDY_38 [Microbacterium phage DizzyRudy]
MVFDEIFDDCGDPCM